jgi:hypothetical protein
MVSSFDLEAAAGFEIHERRSGTGLPVGKKPPAAISSASCA